MESILLRQSPGAFTAGTLLASEGESIWDNPRLLGRNFTLILHQSIAAFPDVCFTPPEPSRAVTVGAAQTITVGGLQSLMRPGARFPYLEFCSPRQPAKGLQARDVTVTAVEFLPGTGTKVSMTASAIIAILIG